MKRILLSLFLFLAFSSAFAQVLPSEKLFFVSDQSRYMQGDTAWIEGRVMRSDNDTVIRPYGRYIYVELAEALDIGIEYTKDKEVVMEMQGYAKTRRGKKLRNGSLVAFRESDQQVYDVKLDEQGRFDMLLEDFAENETFFVQAYDRKGRANTYEYEFFNDTLPAMYNWNRVNKKDREKYTVEIGNLAMENFGVNKVNRLPEVVVKARTRKKQNQSTKEFYSTHFLNQEQLEQRNFPDFRALITHFHAYLHLEEKDGGIGKASGGENEDTNPNKRFALYSRRGASTMQGGEVKILLDGMQISADEAAYLNMSSIGAVEYLTPAEANAVVPFAIAGALLLDTKRHLGTEVESKGIIYVPPMGLANLNLNRLTEETRVPSVPGEYTVFIDLISQHQGIHSFEYDIEVAPTKP